jgi:putative endonuclease
VTNNIARRMMEHRQGEISGFTQRYKVYRLVHVEPFERMYEAIAREKQLKHWNRAWKIRLIEDGNSDWRDLFEDINR